MFAFRITSFRSLINLKFCKRDRKRKSTNIPLSKANRAKIKWHKAILKNPKLLVRNQFSTLQQAQSHQSQGLHFTDFTHYFETFAKLNAWIYARITITNSRPLPSSSARLNFIWSQAPCPTDTIAYKPKQLHTLGVTQGASNKHLKAHVQDWSRKLHNTVISTQFYLELPRTLWDIQYSC